MNDAIAKYGENKELKLPNTGYFLPVIYGILGHKVEKLGDMLPVLEKCRSLLPPQLSGNLWVPYLGHGLDAGMQTLFCYDMEEALKYLDNPIPYTLGEDPSPDNIWLGVRGDVLITGDGPVHQSGRPLVFYGNRGVLDFNLTVYGPVRGLHSGHYGNWAPNPAMRLAQLLASMKDASGRVLVEGFYADVVPLTARERAAVGAMPLNDAELMRETCSSARRRGAAGSSRTSSPSRP